MATLEHYFGLDLFGFTAKWSPYFALFLIFILGLYEYLNAKQDAEKRLPVKTRVLFYASLVAIYVAFGSPIDLLGHLIFSAHMLSMAIAVMVAPPLFILGTPEWMWDWLTSRSVMKKLRWTMHPIYALVQFNVLFSLYHFPTIHDKVMTIYWLHTLIYVMLFVTATMMWWHVTPPAEKYARLTDLRKMGYIFATGFLLTPACALILFTQTPMYAAYSDPKVWMEAIGYCVPGNVKVLFSDLGVSGPAFFRILPPLQDQQLGGVIMKLVQEGINAALLYYVFRKWYNREQKG
jgi:putative membrane protein